MIKSLKYMDIEYTDSVLEYIDYISNEIDLRCDEIVDFFELDNFGEKVHVKLYDDLEEFRNLCREAFKREPQGWVCGFSRKGNVYTLSLSEYRKTDTHEDAELEDLINLILHEFVHSVQFRKCGFVNIPWIGEGFATSLAGQHKKFKEIRSTYEDLSNGRSRYPDYKLMFEYVLNTYGKDYIYELINNRELLNNEEEKLYNEAKSYYEDRKIKH